MKKRTLQFVAVFCVLAMLLSIPAMAAEQASYYLTSYDSESVHVGDGEISINFDVTATGIMDKVGATEIIVYENVLGNWALYYSFDENDTDMISRDDYFHAGTVYCPGYENGYFKVVTYIYAEDYSGGSDMRSLVDYVYT